MVCANLWDAACSSGRSFLVLKLVSIARTMESGSADSRLKIATFCSLPSSFSTKFSFCRLETGPPCSSVTVTKTLTSLTSTLRTVSESWAAQAKLKAPRTSTNQNFFMLDQSFGCGLRADCAVRPHDFLGKRLAIGPHCSILEILLLPDGNGLLKRIDDPAAGLKCRAPMGRADPNQHPWLAAFPPSHPIYH